MRVEANLESLNPKNKGLFKQIRKAWNVIFLKDGIRIRHL